MILKPECPRCGTPLNMMRPALNALSRVDNQTYICPDCGTAEALWDWKHQGRQELPPLNKKIVIYTD